MASPNFSSPPKSVTSVVPSSFHPHTSNTSISLKLTPDNFLIWQQVFATIKGLQLFRFLDGLDIPPKYLSSEDAISSVIIPAFLQYLQQDQPLVAWLLASMNTSVLNQMVDLTPASQIWNKVQIYHAYQSREKIKSLKIAIIF
ncbi:hypothetical protein VIGAN_05147100 [Vigna angularis var. angularis]|uniref:Retrotransposon Copia-like N-terminal domain-containing protein n=1 Tax=Vigna angularis var. angularis TaxID=157739 RepID=A0A0S3S5C8_PHAAN|nr:hypothetical protein VIGAN_05147100 [Vigna angularis var. angularis]